MSDQPLPNVPDPNGPPVLSHAGKTLVSRTGAIVKICVLGGTVSILGLILIPSLRPRRTMGALRSHRLTWEERQKEIAAAQTLSESPEECADPEQPHE
jgi:hypothetical protein